MFYAAYGGWDPWGVGVTPPSLEGAVWGVRQAGTTPFGTGLTAPVEPPAILGSPGFGGFGPGLGGGFGAPPLVLPLHGGGAFMNAAGMGSGFWLSAQNAV